MNYVLPGTALLREGPLQRSGGIPVRPVTTGPSITTRPRRHPLARVRAALSGRRTVDPPGPGGRTPARGGVSPAAGGTSRGVAFFVGR